MAGTRARRECSEKRRRRADRETPLAADRVSGLLDRVDPKDVKARHVTGVFFLGERSVKSSEAVAVQRGARTR